MAKNSAPSKINNRAVCKKTNTNSKTDCTGFLAMISQTPLVKIKKQSIRKKVENIVKNGVEPIEANIGNFVPGLKLESKTS